MNHMFIHENSGAQGPRQHREPHGPLNPMYTGTPFRDEASTAQHSSRFIAAQRAVISWSGPNHEIVMMATAAHAFTVLITGASSPREPPTPQEAVRLAYYMREQGHDVRVQLRPESKQIWCFVARGRRRSDAVYWVQNWETGYVLEMEGMQEAHERLVEEVGVIRRQTRGVVRRSELMLAMGPF